MSVSAMCFSRAPVEIMFSMKVEVRWLGPPPDEVTPLSKMLIGAEGN